VRDALLGRAFVDVLAVELATSEVVTNALVHAEGEVALTVLVEDDFVRVEVADASPALPVAPRAPPDAISGRGMAIVEAVSDRWGVDELPDGGKLVWFTKTATPIHGDEATLHG
jgi:serine/threonine-protein kinase RsbW